MLFLMQSSPHYVRQPIQRVPIYREPEIDASDDEMFMAWFTYMQRYYESEM